MKLLERHFEIALETPDGISKLRELMLSLAMKGKLVPQDPKDKPASELLKEIEVEKKKLIKEGKIKKQDTLPLIKPEEIPYAVPNGWVWVRLGNISEYIQRGKGPIYSEIKKIPVISQKCIQWSGFNKDIVKFIDPDSIAQYQNERFILNGDLLWNSTGTGTIGRINIYKDELNEYSKVVADSHITVVRTIFVNREYTLNYLMSPIVQNDLEENASGTTNQIELNTTMVKNQLIPLPPLAEQKKIVVKINQLMALCDKLEAERNEREKKRLSIHTAAINSLLTTTDKTSFDASWGFINKNFSTIYSISENVEDLKKAILQLAVMGRLVPQDPKDQPASELLKEIEAEKKRLIKEDKVKKQGLVPLIKPEEMPYVLPKGWEWVRLGEVVSLLGDGIHGTPQYDDFGEYFFINGNNLSDGHIEIKENTKKVSIQEYNKYKKNLNSHTVLVSINGTIGNVAFYNNEQVILGKSACYFNLFENINKNYMKKLINTKYFLDYAFSSATGSTIKNVSLKSMREFVFPLPPFAEQKRIVSKIDQLMELCNALETQINDSTKKQTAILDAVLARL